MSNPIKDGGPAFPNRGDNTPSHEIYDGMTLRDYFAGHAMESVAFGTLQEAANTDLGTEKTLRAIAITSYELADAMIEERKGTKP